MEMTNASTVKDRVSALGALVLMVVALQALFHLMTSYRSDGAQWLFWVMLLLWPLFQPASLLCISVCVCLLFRFQLVPLFNRFSDALLVWLSILVLYKELIIVLTSRIGGMWGILTWVADILSLAAVTYYIHILALKHMEILNPMRHLIRLLLIVYLVVALPAALIYITFSFYPVVISSLPGLGYYSPFLSIVASFFIWMKARKIGLHQAVENNENISTTEMRSDSRDRDC